MPETEESLVLLLYNGVRCGKDNKASHEYVEVLHSHDGYTPEHSAVWWSKKLVGYDAVGDIRRFIAVSRSDDGTINTVRGSGTACVDRLTGDALLKLQTLDKAHRAMVDDAKRSRECPDKIAEALLPLRIILNGNLSFAERIYIKKVIGAELDRPLTKKEEEDAAKRKNRG